MTVKLTLEYRTIEEATIALGKLGGLMPTKESAAPPTPPTARGISGPSVVAAVPGPRKPGRPPKNKSLEPPQATPGTPQQSPTTVAAPFVAAPAESPASGNDKPVKTDATVTPGAATSVLEDVQAALERVFNTKGAQAAISLLASFGFKRARDIPAANYAKFIAKANEIAGAA